MSELALSTTQRNQISIFIGQSLKKAMVSNFWILFFCPEIKFWFYISYVINETTHYAGVEDDWEGCSKKQFGRPGSQDGEQEPQYSWCLG